LSHIHEHFISYFYSDAKLQIIIQNMPQKQDELPYYRKIHLAIIMF
jgi:hypothetical protein